MNVPFVDLHAQYLSIRESIDSAIKKVVDETAFISGKYATQFESEFASSFGTKNCIACANGTDSLEILLKAAGIKEGDEVIVPAISWISTSEAISAVGGLPVFVDIDFNFLMDLSKLRAAITPRTKAIIPVHLYGNPVDMNELMKIAKENNLFVLEDCAQSHFAMVGNQLAGTFGNCSSFSFYPGKNLGAYGDAGAMMTNDDSLSSVCRAIANHGQQGKHNHIMEGRNSRMDGIQAAILSAKLPHLASWTESRIKNANIYNERLKNSSVITPIVEPGKKHVFHLYVIRAQRRDELAEFLKSKGVETATHYPTPLPLMKCYANRGFTKSDFPVAAQLSQEILSLPMYPELTEEQIQYVTDQIDAFYR